MPGSHTSRVLGMLWPSLVDWSIPTAIHYLVGSNQIILEMKMSVEQPMLLSK